MKGLDLPFLLFDCRGLLANGLLWVSEAFKDPQSYPISLFDKKANPIENPVRVVSGRVDVYADTDKVSMLLLDNHGRQVWYLTAKDTLEVAVPDNGSPDLPDEPSEPNKPDDEPDVDTPNKITKVVDVYCYSTGRLITPKYAKEIAEDKGRIVSAETIGQLYFQSVDVFNALNEVLDKEQSFEIEHFGDKGRFLDTGGMPFNEWARWSKPYDYKDINFKSLEIMPEFYLLANGYGDSHILSESSFAYLYGLGIAKNPLDGITNHQISIKQNYDNQVRQVDLNVHFTKAVPITQFWLEGTFWEARDTVYNALREGLIGSGFEVCEHTTSYGKKIFTVFTHDLPNIYIHKNIFENISNAFKSFLLDYFKEDMSFPYLEFDGKIINMRERHKIYNFSSPVFEEFKITQGFTRVYPEKSEFDYWTNYHLSQRMKHGGVIAYEKSFIDFGVGGVLQDFYLEKFGA